MPSAKLVAFALAAPLYVTTTGLLNVRPSMSNLGSIFGHILLWCGSMTLASVALQFIARFRTKPVIDDPYMAALQEIKTETQSTRPTRSS